MMTVQLVGKEDLAFQRIFSLRKAIRGTPKDEKETWKLFCTRIQK